VTRSVLPVTWVAFALAVVSGALLFASNAPKYAHNDFFFRKMVLILMAGINMAVFHLILNPNTNRDSSGRAVPVSDRVVGLVSMLLWIGVIACGRWIGFTMVGG
jgi:general stress protein CsbA